MTTSVTSRWSPIHVPHRAQRLVEAVRRAEEERQVDQPAHDRPEDRLHGRAGHDRGHARPGDRSPEQRQVGDRPRLAGQHRVQPDATGVRGRDLLLEDVLVRIGGLEHVAPRNRVQERLPELERESDDQVDRIDRGDVVERRLDPSGQVAEPAHRSNSTTGTQTASGSASGRPRRRSRALTIRVPAAGRPAVWAVPADRAWASSPLM